MDLGRYKWRLRGVAAVAAVTLAAAGCGGSSGGSSSSSASSGAKIKGGTVAWAEPPGSPPNWIWPFVPITNYSVYNSQTFQWLMYRPLYMFGNNGNSTTVNIPLSPANAPVFSNGNKTVVINMKGWKWSDGETVDAKDVMFWINLENAESTNYAGYVPGTFPSNLTSYKATGPNQVTMTTNKAYSTYWFLYNQLAEVTPMPEAWDITHTGAAAGSGGCSTDTAADHWAKCKAVYTFLLAQTKDTSTYATSPLWGVVDGPWKLASFDTSGNDSFVPNKSYSGSPKPTLAMFKEVPFTDDSTEYTALRTGTLDVGYVPTADLPQRSGSAALPSTNPLGSSFTLAPYYAYGIFYWQPDFNNPTVGYVFRQLYVRQALQMVDDQPGIDAAVYRGYSVPTSGPVPTVPPNQWTPAIQNSNGGQGPYPFNVAKATSLLTSHGWKMVSGVMTCESPGTGMANCGTGIKKGQTLSFTLDYSTGTAAFTSEASVYKSDASKAGININVVGQSFNTVIGESSPCPAPGSQTVSSKCTAEGLMYGGWLFNGPGFEPTGEPLFATGAGSNSGNYSNPQVDSLINATHTSSSLAVFHQYATYTAQQLPFIWMPNPYTVQAVSTKVHNVTFNSFGTLLPEYWYRTK